MTEKRFTFDEDVNDDRMYEMGVFLDNGEIMETTDVLECLNTLHEENKQLKVQLETANDDKEYVKQVIKDRIKHFHSYSCINSSPQDHKGCWGLKIELEKFYDDVESYL